MSSITLCSQKIYAFYIYHNERMSKDYLLFKGIGVLKDNKVEIFHEHDYMITQYNFLRLNNYYDMVEKFGDLQCVIVNEKYNVIDSFFDNQKEIEKKYNISVSPLYSRAYKANDTIKLNKLSELKEAV